MVRFSGSSYSCQTLSSHQNSIFRSALSQNCRSEQFDMSVRTVARLQTRSPMRDEFVVPGISQVLDVVTEKYQCKVANKHLSEILTCCGF